MSESIMHKCDICHEETLSPYWIKPQSLAVEYGYGNERTRLSFTVGMCRRCQEKLFNHRLAEALIKGMEAMIADEKD